MYVTEVIYGGGKLNISFIKRISEDGRERCRVKEFIESKNLSEQKKY